MKKVLISILSIIFIISMFSSVYAATGNISSGASSGTVVKGKTFTLTLAATADSPIEGMYTKFNYDKSVLSIESATAGENYASNSGEGEILVSSILATTSPKSATLYTITFKVLDTAQEGTTTISFNEAELHLNADGAINNFNTTIDNVVVNVKSDDTTIGGEEDKNSVTPSNNNISNSTNNNNTSSGNEVKNTNKNVNTNKNTTKLPQTGVENLGVLGIVGLGIISIISYISYKKYKNV